MKVYIDTINGMVLELAIHVYTDVYFMVYCVFNLFWHFDRGLVSFMSGVSNMAYGPDPAPAGLESSSQALAVFFLLLRCSYITASGSFIHVFPLDY